MSTATETILVVEDDFIVRRALLALIHRSGYHTIEVGGVREAQAALAAHPIDVVVLDLGLPDGSGFDVLATVRELSERPMVIVCTGDETQSAAIDALRLGAFDFLNKPIQAELLWVAVRRALEYRQLRRSLREAERARAQEEAMRATARAAAHYISQCLTIIMGEAQLIDRTQAWEEMQEGLNRIVIATERAAETLDSLRNARYFVTSTLPLNATMLDLDAANIDDDPAEASGDSH